MSKVAILTDSHFGWSNDSPVFEGYFKRFYDDIFFPTLKEHGIKELIHLGDVWDRRKYLNINTASTWRDTFFQNLTGIRTHILLGNHDVYYRDTNRVNSVWELCRQYDNLWIYDEPEDEVVIGGRKMLFIPWLNPSNMDVGLGLIKKSKCDVLMGHLEIAGFHYDRHTLCEHGLDRSIFKKFKKVFSGHFHMQSHDKNIQYLGSPYQLTFADYKDQRGFHIFDTETLELEFIPNHYEMFHKITYDDRDPATHKDMLTEDFSQYHKTHVKLTVAHKTDPYLYDRWLTRLEEVDLAKLNTVEEFCLGVDDTVDDQFGEFQAGKEVIQTDTVTILDSYVEGITGVELDKKRLKELMRSLYSEAMHQAA